VHSFGTKTFGEREREREREKKKWMLAEIVILEKGRDMS